MFSTAMFVGEDTRVNLACTNTNVNKSNTNMRFMWTQFTFRFFGLVFNKQQQQIFNVFAKYFSNLRDGRSTCWRMFYRSWMISENPRTIHGRVYFFCQSELHSRCINKKLPCSRTRLCSFTPLLSETFPGISILSEIFHPIKIMPDATKRSHTFKQNCS